MQWTIKKKLYLGFGFAVFLLVGLVSGARWAQERAVATEKEITDTMGMLKDLEHLIGYIHAVTSAQRAYLISGNENAVAGIPALRQDARETVARITTAISGKPGQMANLEAYQAAIKERIVFVNALNAARKDQGFDAAKQLFDTGKDDQLLATIQVAFNAMRDAATAQLKAEEAANIALQHRLAWMEGLSVLVAVVLLIGIGSTLTHSIRRNVQIAIEMVETMAEKDLSQADGEPATNDELASAILAINRMKEAMATALTDIARATSQVAAAGVEIDAAAHQIADTVREEKSDVEQFASSLAEMNAAVKEVAEHAEQASFAANDAVSSAAAGRNVVLETQKAMNRIHDSVTAASGDITVLGNDTQSIGEVVRIIQDIAEQTNLLALNAAIEAARAGEQGKGFAVVAQEVRVLAERTGKFTKEIASKIDSVQNGASRAVESMKQGEAVVNAGVRQFTEVSTVLDSILQKIETAQQGISLIATAATEQSAATEGLTESIHRISSEVNRTAAEADQTATACAELAHLSSDRQAVVDGFQLPSDSKPSSGTKRRAQGRAA
jgi:methyl-accepting chemotaxis protein